MKEMAEPLNRPEARKKTIMVEAVSRCSGGTDLEKTEAKLTFLALSCNRSFIAKGCMSYTYAYMFMYIYGPILRLCDNTIMHSRI